MRKASLDVCRVLACMMVVLGHSGDALLGL